jgi:predicted O-methyltransferase YrrM
MEENISERLMKLRGRHYAPLYSYLANHECCDILEIGTNTGVNAIAMIQQAKKKAPEDMIDYYGFDLFEELNRELVDREFSFETSGKAEEVKKMIETEAKVNAHIFKGNTNITLPEHYKTLPMMDLVYIDGGHSIDTIENDWKYCKEVLSYGGVAFFDDYFPEMPFIGCKVTVDKIDRIEFIVEVLPTITNFQQAWGIQKAQLVMVKRI